MGLALGLAGLIGVGAALLFAAPARTAETPFELTFEGELTPPLFPSTAGGMFTSRAPFCASGTFVAADAGFRFTCGDGTGSLTVLLGLNAMWPIHEGTGRYADLRGSLSLRSEVLCEPWRGESCDLRKPIPWWGTLVGVVDSGAERDQPGADPVAPAEADTVAPTVAFSRATARKLRRPAGAYALRVGITLRDDVAVNRVWYTLHASAGGVELARRIGTTRTGAVSLTLRIRPPAGARTVRLALTGADPFENEASVSRALRLPR